MMLPVVSLSGITGNMELICNDAILKRQFKHAGENKLDVLQSLAKFSANSRLLSDRTW
jgi:hypothetical protein